MLAGCGGRGESAPVRPTPGAILTVTSPALDAGHVETEIVAILEEALGRAGFDQVDAVSRPGLATLYIGPHGDPDLLLERIRAAIPLRDLPSEADPPLIRRQAPEPHHFVVGSDRLSAMELGSRPRLHPPPPAFRPLVGQRGGGGGAFFSASARSSVAKRDRPR